MPYTFDSVLNDPLIAIVSRDDAQREFKVCFGVLKTVVTFNVEMDPTLAQFGCRQSHAIKTPMQAGVRRTNNPYDDDDAYVLHRVIGGFIEEYSAAVMNKLQPKEGWLVFQLDNAPTAGSA